jgi:hypothetical protein
MAPQSEPMRLFEREPQLSGQTWLVLEARDD